jgi:hypothetical protein
MSLAAAFIREYANNTSTLSGWSSWARSRRRSGFLGCPGFSERLLLEIEADDSGEDRGGTIDVTALRRGLRKEEIDGSGLVRRCPTLDRLTDDEEVFAGFDRLPRGELEFAEPASQFDALGALSYGHLGGIEGSGHLVAPRLGSGGPAEEEKGIGLEGIGIGIRPGDVEVGPVAIDRPVVVPVDGCLLGRVEMGGRGGGHPCRPSTDSHRHHEGEATEASDEEDRGYGTLHGEKASSPESRRGATSPPW